MLSGVEDHPGAAQPPKTTEAPAPEDQTVAPRHLLDIDDLSRDEIVALLDRAEEFRRNRPQPPLPLQGKVVGLFFFQPSTRTRIGFHAAAARLGATAIELNTTKYEPGMSAAETPLDTFRSVASYCDLIILRHHDEDEFHQMVAQSPVPIINGGCGTSSHPTQTLVDLFFIRSHFGRIEELRIGIVGDLAGSRAAKSLVKALRHFPPKELRLMAPEGRELDPAYYDDYLKKPIIFPGLSTGHIDALYIAGFPEGHEMNPTPQTIRTQYQLTLDDLDSSPEAVLLCPLPRIDEIHQSLDSSPQSSFFQQSALGLFSRIAIISNRSQS